jgi:hypothetical protein
VFPVIFSNQKVPAIENPIPSVTKKAMRSPRKTQHQEQAEQGVALHHRQRLARLRRLVVREAQVDTGRFELAVLFGDVAVYPVDQVQGVRIRDLRN